LAGVRNSTLLFLQDKVPKVARKLQAFWFETVVVKGFMRLK